VDVQRLEAGREGSWEGDGHIHEANVARTHKLLGDENQSRNYIYTCRCIYNRREKQLKVHNKVRLLHFSKPSVKLSALSPHSL